MSLYLELVKGFIIDVVSKDTESVAVECEDVSLPVFEPHRPVELGFACEFDLNSSNIGVFLVLLIVHCVSDEDHLALHAVVKQDVLVG